MERSAAAMPLVSSTLNHRPAETDCGPWGLLIVCGTRPKNLFMLSGGIAELFHSSPRTNTVVFRKGLCMLSLEKQASLVPIYLFGGNDFFSNFATGTGFAARASRQVPPLRLKQYLFTQLTISGHIIHCKQRLTHSTSSLYLYQSWSPND